MPNSEPSVSAKENFLIKIKFAATISTWMIRKSNRLTAHMKKGVVARIKDQTSLNIPLNQGIIQSKFPSLFSSMVVCLFTSVVSNSLWPYGLQPTRTKTIPIEKKCKKSKMAVWGGLTNSCEKKRTKKQRRKGKI